MKKTFLIIFLIYFSNTNAQIGIGTITPNDASILEISTTNKGVLFNKLKLLSTDNPYPLSSHQEGLWVYNTVQSGVQPNEVYPGLYYNDGKKWILLNTDISNPKIGDIKASISVIEHDGWYLLDGRSISTLPTNARLNANNIGIINNLPDSTDRILKGVGNSETFATIGGSNSITLTQDNLPNIVYTGNVNSVSDHTHNYDSYANTSWNYNGSSGVTGLRNLATETRTTEPAGAHSHTVSIPTGGTGTPIINYPKNFTTQYFIYLGN
ncbi:hypothetical protein [Chishuiella sp.]|uniref:hypothetical protein n=1 Tax=Chishuiella sp. TaxID=1969467 RepID=UPI0028A68D64|nr:hypothetical protein [Chishuiella sp.]